MREITINNYSLHRVDVAEDSAKRLLLQGDKGLQIYADKVIQDLLDSPRSRYFRFSDANELVPSVVTKVKNGEDWGESSESMAQKLHRVELEAQEGIEKLGQTVTRGGLLQLDITEGDTEKFIIVKIDDSEFLDEEDGLIKSGLPLKTRVQKAAIISLSDEAEVTELLVSDSRSTITPYWYNSFLEAIALKDAETNTKNAFDTIDALINTEFKRKGLMEDYWLLRNELVYYFRNEEGFVFDKLKEQLRKHKPESEDTKNAKASFLGKLEKLPKHEKKGFDTQFDLKTAGVTLRIKRNLFTDKNFKLDILRDVENLRSKITPEIDAKGKHIKVYSDDGFDSLTNRIKKKK